MKSLFPNHTGGVLQVQHTGRWGAVPEAMLEDARLDLDSRAVAAWLSVKPSGWQINIAVLRKRLAKEGKEMLGRDRWHRIAHELEAAGYLLRKKRKGSDGKWVWNIVFNSVPSMYGLSGDGFAEDGVSEVGKPVHIDVPMKELTIKTDTDKATTTTTTTVESDSDIACQPLKRSGGDFYTLLKIEPEIYRLKDQLIRILEGDQTMELAMAQDLLDELAGSLVAAKRGERQSIASPLSWFRHLVMAAKNNMFDRVFCDAVQRRREEMEAKNEKDRVSRFPISSSRKTAEIHIALQRDLLRTKRKWTKQ